jgi:hypothetical protein
MTEPLPYHEGMASEVRQCGREGCARRKRNDGYCSALCLEIDRRLTKTRALIAEKGISPTAAELWAATVSLSDQLSEVNRLEKLLRAPQAVG